MGVPSKIKFFAWVLVHNRTNARGNLLHKNIIQSDASHSERVFQPRRKRYNTFLSIARLQRQSGNSYTLTSATFQSDAMERLPSRPPPPISLARHPTYHLMANLEGQKRAHLPGRRHYSTDCVVGHCAWHQAMESQLQSWHAPFCETMYPFVFVLCNFRSAPLSMSSAVFM